MHLPTPPDRMDEAALDHFRLTVKNLPGPVFVHCASGKRSGTFAIAHTAVDSGQSGDAALARIKAESAAYGSDAMRDVVRRCYVDSRSKAVSA